MIHAFPPRAPLCALPLNILSAERRGCEQLAPPTRHPFVISESSQLAIATASGVHNKKDFFEEFLTIQFMAYTNRAASKIFYWLSDEN
jgi:hypothetical protein